MDFRLLIFVNSIKSKTYLLLKNYVPRRNYLRFVMVGGRSITQRKPIYDLEVSWYS
jgi:hypothetical protein